MTGHLPDCDDYAFSGAGFHPNCDRICICRQVRRIEQRVLEEEQSHLPAVLFGNGDEKAVLQIRDMAYAAGVQAARDAVAGVGVRKDTSHDMRVQALAAIDALRGSGNPHTPPSAEKGEQK